MTGLLTSILTQIDGIYQYLVSIRCCQAVKQTLNIFYLFLLRFRDSKTTFGKLRFFFHLCEKLKHDIGEFAEILAPSRKGFHIGPIKIWQNREKY